MAQYDKSFISSIHFLDKREILSQVLDVQNEAPSFLDVMEGMRRSVPTSSAVFHNYVNAPVYEQVTLTGSAAGNNLTHSSLRAGDVIVDVSNNTMWYLKAVANLSDATKRVKLGGTGTAIADGASIVVISNAHGEGSGAPEGLRYGLTKQSGKVQIFKNSYKLTDVELTNKVEVEFQGKPYYMYAAQHNALNKFRNDIAHALAFGYDHASTFSGYSNDYSDASQAGAVGGVTGGQVTDADGNPVQFTKGLVEHCKDGLDFTGSAGDANDFVGAATLGDFGTIVTVMDQVRAPYEYLLFGGTGANIGLDNLLKNLGSSGVTSVRMNVAGTSVDYGMEQFKLYGRSFVKKAFPQFSHAAGKNALANASDSLLFIPNDKIKVQGGSGMVDRMRVRYLESPSANLAYKEWMLGGLAPTPTDGRSVLECVYESAQGLEVLGREHFGIAQFA